MHNAPRASVLWFLPVVMLSVYRWGYFWPAYIRRSNVSVSAGTGCYKDYWKASQEIHFEKPTWLGRQIRWMLMGLSHDGSNPDEGYTFLLGVWVWSCTPIRNLNSISTCRLDSRDDKWGEASTATLRTGGFDNKRLQAQQQIQLYQARITRAFNKKVKERTFKKEDLSYMLEDLWWWRIRPKKNSNPNGNDHL